MLKEALARRILRETFREVGHGGEAARLERQPEPSLQRRGLPGDRSGRRPGLAKMSLVLTYMCRRDRVRRHATEKRTQILDAAASGVGRAELPNAVLVQISLGQI